MGGRAGGRGLTQVGGWVGLRRAGSKVAVLGICVRRGGDEQAERVLRRASEAADMIGKPGLIGPQDVWVDDRVLAPGYGIVNDETVEAISLAAPPDGLLLDPVYSGKALGGLSSLLRDGVIPADPPVVFLHPGATPSPFSCHSLLRAGGCGVT